MKNNHIQFTYESPSEALPKRTEKRLAEALHLLMADQDLSDRIVSLFFCSVETIVQLNGTYRNRGKPTDLLSWLYQDDEMQPNAAEETWGELVYCIEVICRQATASGWELEDELLRLTVHGLVHLLGYDHENDADEAVMLGFEKKLLQRIGLTGVYES